MHSINSCVNEVETLIDPSNNDTMEGLIEGRDANGSVEKRDKLKLVAASWHFNTITRSINFIHLFFVDK